MTNRQLIWIAGKWSTEDKAIIGITAHALWMGSTVFDGARSIQGYLPDLEAHCQRSIASAKIMAMEPNVTCAEIMQLVRQGLKQLPHHTDYYIKILFFTPGGFIQPDPATTTLAIHIFEAELPEDSGFSATFSPYCRPGADMAPTEAKAACLYPNSQRILREASARGFANAIVNDNQGKVAEFATANLWIVKDGIAYTPEANGTFLNGITRQRLIGLLREDGIITVEKALSAPEVLAADEVFSSGNYGKVLHCNRLETRDLVQGPIAKKAKALYQKFTLESEQVSDKRLAD